MAEFHIVPDNLTPLRGKVVLITGSSSGIGKATVNLCLDLGAKVIAGDLSPPPAEQSSAPSQAFIFAKTDVTDWASIRNLFITGQKHFGHIDHVFANAGIGPRSNFLEETFDEDNLLAPPKMDTVNINLLGVINTVRLGVFYLRQGSQSDTSAEGGRVTKKSIVLTASASSFQNFGATDYTTAKHGVLGILRGLVGDLQREGLVRMNAIAPSWTATGLVPKDVLASLGIATQEPEVVAKSVVLLFNDPERHGELIYSWEGRYMEINKGEGGMLEATLKMLPVSDTEDDVMEKLKGLAAASK